MDTSSTDGRGGMSGLWNPRIPLNQPPGYGRVGHHNTPAPKPDDAKRAVLAAQFDRDAAAARVGGRRAVVRG